MQPLANETDYRARYPDDEVDDETLREVLMEASDLIWSELDASDIDYEDPSESFTYRLMRVCRTVAHRAIGGGGGESDVPFGASQHSWTEDVYTESVRFANPYGDLFLTEAERRSLGIGAGSACVLSPYG